MAKKQPKSLRKPLAEVNAIYHALRAESDRGCIVVGAAWVESQLGELIRCLMTLLPSTRTIDAVKKPKLIDEVLNDRFSLGSAASRRQFCRAVGLIDERMCKSIELLSQLRNHYAHWAGPSDLKDPHVQDSLRKLFDSIPDKGETADTIYGELPEALVKQCGDDRNKLIWTVIYLIERMANAMKTLVDETEAQGKAIRAVVAALKRHRAD
jgi:hypothetical protein